MINVKVGQNGIKAKVNPTNTKVNNSSVKVVKGEKGDPFKYSDFTPEQLEALKVKGDAGYTPIKGKDYFDGVDGISPSVTVEDTETGAIISITDKDGNTQAELKNGKDGKTPIKGVDYFDGNNGYTPVKGIDYFDGQKGEDGKTPVKGVDYFDGYTPVKNVDYFDGKDYVITQADYEAIARLVNVPTKVSQLENDSGFITGTIPSDDHINSLIDAKLGVIENGSY